VAIKYVSVAMRVDNDGEGALIALPAGRDKKRSAIIAFGLFGAALIYGDDHARDFSTVGAEGLSILTNRFDP
jgi:KUP system potassium uptake protein